MAPFNETKSKRELNSLQQAPALRKAAKSPQTIYPNCLA
jgi:hypothetical protein